MGENIGDLGGILLGLEAYRLSLKGQSAPVLDGFTGDQRVFLGWGQVWRTMMRDDAPLWSAAARRRFWIPCCRPA